MRPALRPLVLATVVLSVVSGGGDASAQYFGKNKVEYVDFEFKILETAHFDVYYYPDEAAAARLAAALAERWYARLSCVLGEDLHGRQPLILYGSQPEFAQTNVVSTLLGEGIGGVTEFARRRIVMPFAPTLAETDHVLGHEIAHAFQADITRRHGGRSGLPAWAIEGMAQYLSLGPADAETATWLRDAVAADLLPPRQQTAARQFSPYRYGHALWAYLAGRFGDGVVRDVLTAGRSKSFADRVYKATGADLDQVFEQWRASAGAARDGKATAAEPTTPHGARPLVTAGPKGRVYLGPALSPDGNEAVFFSERDRLSLDLFLADTATGLVRRKLATTSGSAAFESLQPIRSAGSWSWDGNQFVFAAVQHGHSVLVLLDMRGRREPRRITVPHAGQVLTPSWSPDGSAVAFAALKGGFTDLYVYELQTGNLRRLTNDAFADLQPAWSPDGRQIAFVTDRFSTDLDAFTFGPPQLAVVELASGAVRALPGITRAKHLNPQWAHDGRSLFFVSDPSGVSNVYRLDLGAGTLFQITHVPTGVTGLTGTSPALSVAHHAPVAAFTVYRAGKYEVDVLRGPDVLTGEAVPDSRAGASDLTRLPPVARGESLVETLLGQARVGLVDRDAFSGRAYRPDLSLEAVGQPYVSSGGGPLGSFVRGGGSLMFGDMLGERKLATAVQVGNHLRDLAIETRYLNRERRWNWGAILEVEPSIRRLFQQRVTEQDGEQTLAQETQYFQQTQFRLAGLLAYPLNQARRLELAVGVRHARYRQDVRSRVSSMASGRVLSVTTSEGSGGAPATVGDASLAFVGDTAVFGPTGPILGSRYRFEIAPNLGDLSLTRVLLDYRRYVMPVKPYTVALRVLHAGGYGPDANDPRLIPTFLGSRYLVRGYGWHLLRCQWDTGGACAALDELVGRRLLVANVEARFPLRGMFSGEIKYGPIPLEGFLFADTGTAWSRRTTLLTSEVRRFIRSVGVGLRANAGGLPFEVAAVRALDAPARGWSFDVSFRQGF